MCSGLDREAVLAFVPPEDVEEASKSGKVTEVCCADSRIGDE